MKTAPFSLALSILATSAFVAPLAAKTADGKPLIVMIAGRPSHGPGQHEHNAGIQLLSKCLNEGAPQVVTKVHLSGEWPSDEELAQADSVVIYADGGGGHVALQGEHLQQLGAAMKRGAGLVCLHYAVEVPAEKGGPEFLQWLGGYFEANWSVNPHWKADFTELPKHLVSNGVQPFSTTDEWYFHMRFPEDPKGLTHVLSAVPPDSTMSRKDGPHEGNPTVRAEVAAKKPQTVAWAYERPDGKGRGFGFCGGHFHNSWGNNDQRKLVLNAIVWTANAEVPANGVDSKVSEEELAANLDPKAAPKPKAPAPAPTK